MAIKHVVTDGLGFTVPSYLLTEGIGDFSAGGAPPPALDLWRYSPFGLRLRKMPPQSKGS